MIDLLDFIAYIPLTHFLLQKSWSEFLMNFVVICFCFRQYEKSAIVQRRDIIRILQKSLSKKPSWTQISSNISIRILVKKAADYVLCCLVFMVNYRKKLTKTTLMQLMHQSLSMSLNWFGTFTHELLKHCKFNYKHRYFTPIHFLVQKYSCK